MPSGGIRMSSTNDVTIFPKAAPITTPTARSTTLPLSANSRNSLMTAIGVPPVILSPAMIRQIAVIGSGTMGRGIAYLAAVAGYETVLHDVDQDALDVAKAAIESTMRKGVEKGKLAGNIAAEASERLQITNELEPAVHGADLVIEAVPESLELKS